MKEKMMRIAFSAIFLLFFTKGASALARDAFGGRSFDGGGPHVSRGGNTSAASPVSVPQAQPQSYRPSAPVYRAPQVSAHAYQTPSVARSYGYSTYSQPRVQTAPTVQPPVSSVRRPVVSGYARPDSGTYVTSAGAASRYRPPTSNRQTYNYGTTRETTAMQVGPAAAAQPGGRSTSTYRSFSPQTAHFPVATPAPISVNADHLARVSSPITRINHTFPRTTPNAFSSGLTPGAALTSQVNSRPQNLKPVVPAQSLPHVSFSRQNDPGVRSHFLANGGPTGPKRTVGGPSRTPIMRADALSFGTAFNRTGDSVDRFGRAIRPQAFSAISRSANHSPYGHSLFRHDGWYGDRHVNRYDGHGRHNSHGAVSDHFYFSGYGTGWHATHYTSGIGFSWHGHHSDFSLCWGASFPCYYATTCYRPALYMPWYGNWYGAPVYYSGGWCTYSTSFYTPVPFVNYYTFEQPVTVTAAAPVCYEQSAEPVSETPTVQTETVPTAAEASATEAQAQSVPPLPAAETAVELPTAAALTLADSATGNAVTAPIPQAATAPTTTNALDNAAAPTAEATSLPTQEEAWLDEEFRLYEDASDVQLHFSSYAEGLSAETFWASYTGNDRDDDENTGWGNSPALAGNLR